MSAGPTSRTPDGDRRRYDSPLRERQAQQTRETILDALTLLLQDRSPVEITIKELAEAAGVSERTVYRHFPDRAALVQGLTARLAVIAGRVAGPDPGDDLRSIVVALMHDLEAHRVEARAEAVLNADPRRYSEATRAHTQLFADLVGTALPDLDDEQHRAVSAIVRVLVSAQTWLRLREEFGLDGDASGPIVAWAIDALVHEVERGNLPPTPS
jgi:AcrR family transcriptional regulator